MAREYKEPFHGMYPNGKGAKNYENAIKLMIILSEE
jgi:hypothetical protein